MPRRLLRTNVVVMSSIVEFMPYSMFDPPWENRGRR